MLGKKINAQQLLDYLIRSWKILVSTRRFTAILTVACFAIVLAVIPVLTLPDSASAITKEKCSELGGTVMPGTGSLCTFNASQLSKADCTANKGTAQEKSNPSGQKQYNGCQITLTGAVVDSSIKSSSACTAAGGVWQADGNHEGPGEIGTCTLVSGGTVDPSIQTKAACTAAEGVWKADGNYEGQGEMGTCTVFTSSLEGTEEGGEEEEQLSCKIDGIGWILCPIVNSMGRLTDASYGMVEQLLTVQSSMFSQSDSTGGNAALNSAWSAVRNLANVAFVIAFLIIIYSQLTGVGIGNYGVKKMLPRLIISAILVNASFLIGALAVDLSNIIGTATSSFIDGLSSSMSADIDGNQLGSGSFWSDLTVSVLAGGAIVGVAAGVAGATTVAGAAAWVGITILLPIIIAAVAAILIALIVLTLRQALIVVLIVVAPLAFVAFLLPNTEGLFKKWLNLFIALLVMFPAIALVFSVSKLAGMIVMAAGESTLIQIAGAGMTIIPLFITPILIKTAGSTLGRITGMVNQKGKGIYGMQRSLKDSEKARRKNQLTENMNGGKGIRGRYNRLRGTPSRLIARQKARDQRTEMGANAARSGVMLENHGKFLEQQADLKKQGVASDDMKVADAKVISAVRGQLQSDEQTDVKNAKAEFAPLNADELKKELEASINTGDKIKMMASIDLLGNMGNKGVNNIEKVLSDKDIEAKLAPAGPGKSNEMRTEVARSVGPGMMAKSEAIKKFATMTDSSGSGPSMAQAMEETIDGAGSFSMEKFRGQTPSMQKEMIKSGKLSENTIRSSLDSKNVGGFEDGIVNDLTQALADKKFQTTQTASQPNATAQAGPDLSLGTSQTPAPGQAQAKISNDNSILSIPHANPSSPSATQAAPAAPAGAQPTTAKPAVSDIASQMAQELRTAKQATAPTTPQPAAPVAQQPAPATSQPIPVASQPAPAAAAQPQKVDVNFTVNDKRGPQSQGFSGFPPQPAAPASAPSTSPPARGSRTDTAGRQTPNSASADYHDRMSR